MSDLSEFKRFATVQEVVATLDHLLATGKIPGNAIFLTSKDPEGNGFVGYEAQDAMDTAVAGSIVPERLGFRLVEGRAETPGTAVLMMPTFEVDPEF